MRNNKSISINPKIRSAVIMSFIFVTILTSGYSFAATQLSQFGITWTFDGDYQTGQFANGDYWVIGPVTITGINPPSRSGGRVMNGSMLNPSPTSGSWQGYDSSMYAGYSSAYANDLNVALDVSSSNPLTIQPDNSLVSSISVSTAAALPQLKTAAVLTVLDGPPPEGSFRPPYSGRPKTIKFNKSQLDYSLLSKLAPVSGTPALSTIERDFERPWIDHVTQWLGRYCHPADNMPDYGRELSRDAGTGALMLHLNFSDAQKETLMIRYVQVGIDLFGIVQDGGNNVWVCDGGHASGRKWPILFAGLVLGDGDMMNIGRADLPGYGPGHSEYVHFGEDDQTFYVSQSDISSGRYNQSDLGLPEWGIRHATHPNLDNRDWNAKYRQCCTANSWAGGVLAARIMGVRDLWNHEALFDYQDRFMDLQIGAGWERQQSTFTANMWDTYRADYGGIWPDSTPPETDNTPPLPPADLTASNIGATSISLTWTAPQAASDGDLASGYRIYRDGQSLGTVNDTTFTDSSLAPETEYSYSVFSYDNANNQSGTGAEGFFSTIAGVGNGTPPPTTGQIPLPPPPQFSAQYYVSPSGNDGNSGTSWTQAFRNLPSNLQRNAVYYCAGGTYPDYTFSTTGSASQYITIRKATIQDHGTETGWSDSYANTPAVFGEFRFSSASHVYIDGASPSQTAIRWNNSGPVSAGSVLGFSGANNITILNCDIDGNFQGSSSSQSNGACNCVGMQNSNSITIIGCLIHDAADDGLEIFSSGNLDISYNEVYDLHGCGTDGGCGPCYNGHSDGFEVFNVSNSRFVANFIHNIPSTSAFFFGGWASSSAEYCRNLLFANNIIYNNRNTGFLAYIQMADNITLYNNTFWGMAGGAYGGLSIGRNVTDMELYNNIILSINYSHMGASYNASQHRGDYNFFGVSLGQYGLQANDITAADPGFVGINGANGPLISSVSRDDFMLTESSRCVDSGTSVDLDLDIAANTRPIGSTFDRGAFEYGIAGPDTTPPTVTSVTTGETFVQIRFSEPVEQNSATDTSNYAINNITINRADLNTQTATVTLQTSLHESNADYELTVNNVQDLAGNTIEQYTYSYTFVQDLVGHWQFDETGGATSQDLSDFGNTASLVNGAALNGTGEIVLDGIDDAVEVSMENMLNSAGTIAVMAQQTDPAGSQYLFGHTVGTWSNRIQVYLDNGNLGVGIGNTHSSSVNIEQFTSGVFYLVALTWNSGEYSVYVNGELKASGNYSGLDSLGTFADFGNDGNTDFRDEALNGSIREAWIFNYAMTAEQVAGISAPPRAEDNLVGNWQFNETGGDYALDSSDFGNTASLINGPLFSGVGSLTFDGIDDAVEVSMQNMRANAGTVAILVSQAEATGSQYIFGHTVGSWSNRLQIYLDNGSLGIGLGDTHTTSVGIEQFQPDQSYLVAVTWNSGQYSVYVDGELKATGNYSGLDTFNTFADIGNDGNPDYRGETLNGSVEEAWIFNYALTAEQIAGLSTSTPPSVDTSLVGQWQFNETSGTSAADSTEYNNTAELINGANFSGQGYVIFDGVDDAVEISMENMQANAGTIALRLTPTGFSQDQSLSNYLFGHSAADWSNRIQLYLRQSSLTLGLGDNHELRTGIEVLTVDQSYHVALTWQAGTYHVYVNGQDMATGPYTGLDTLNTIADIGNTGNPNLRNESLQGTIVEARIYNRALTAEQIVELAVARSYGYEMLNLIMTHWLDYHPDADIAPPGGDGIINLRDFVELSENWEPQTQE